jgi:hypothetical protein
MPLIEFVLGLTTPLIPSTSLRVPSSFRVDCQRTSTLKFEATICNSNDKEQLVSMFVASTILG